MTNGRRWLHEAYTVLRFGTVGILATLVHYGTLTSLLSLAGMAPVPSNFIAYVLAVIVSFVGHHYWTYRARGPVIVSFVKFLGASFAAFLVSTLLLVTLLHMQTPKAIAAFLAVAIVPAITFVAFRLWVFRQRHD